MYYYYFIIYYKVALKQAGFSKQTRISYSPGPVFTKLFRFRIKIRLKFQYE